MPPWELAAPAEFGYKGPMAAASEIAPPATWRSAHRSPEQTRILDAVLRRVEEAASAGGAIVTFDLDSTLFDNRPRQLRILEAFARDHGLTGVERLSVESIDGWRLSESIARLDGLDGRLEALTRAFKPFWRDRFFTSAFCRHDVPLPGASNFVRDVESKGGTVAYLTGRHEAMREGTVGSLLDGGFVPGTLLLKPTFEMTDTQWKEIAVARLRAMGDVAASFDNETTHVNRLRDAFPGAMVVWVRTDYSPGAEALRGDVPAIDGFLR